MDALIRDFRHAARQLRRTPAFTIIAVLTLALGIGANSAIFSLFDQVMLRALPVREPGRLVILQFNNVDQGMLRSQMYGGYYFSEPMFRELAKRTRTLDLLARAPSQAAVSWNGDTEQVDSEMVSGNYFQVLGIRPEAGRLIDQNDDEKKNGSPAVVLSYAFWQRRFGGKREVVGTSISVNSHPFTIIGIAPPGFRSSSPVEAPSIFVPITMQPQVQPGFDWVGEWRARWLNVIGRLRTGVSRETAQAEINPIWHALREDDLARMRAAHKGPGSARARDQFLSGPLVVEEGARGLSPVRHDAGAPLSILMGMVGLVLLIACANIATLLLARGAGRQRQIAVCYALGASRGRVMRQLLSESLLLGLCGGILGLVISPWALGLLLRAIPAQADITPALTNELDSRVLIFTFAIAFLTSILAGIAPALRFSAPNPALALKDQSISVAGGRSQLRRLLVASQIGLGILLLVAAGLFTRSLFNLKNVDLGFATEREFKFNVNAKLKGYDDQGALAVYQRITEALSQVPGASAVASDDTGLLDGNQRGTNITIDSYHAAPDEDIDVNYTDASPGYFAAMNISLLAGRDFSQSDAGNAPKVCIVNETLAKRFLGGAQHAVGHFIALGNGDNIHPDIQIIGVARNTKYSGVKEDPLSFMYFPYLQENKQGGMSFYVRNSLPPDEAANEIRQAVHQIDAGLPIQFLQTMEQHFRDSLAPERIVSILSLVFGSLAALLAAVGLYGLLAYSVTQRTREIGIRVALGASRRNVARLVLQDLLVLGGAAIAVALPLSFALAHFLRSQLYGISAHDPLTYAGVLLVVAATTLVAGVVPALRASRLDPLTALRAE